MSSPIEDIIEEIEDYIDSCKPSAFSSTKISINRDELFSLISELKSKIPEEVSRYQKIISNKEAIIEDAKRQAREIIAAAEIHTDELVSEHQIMQQAYAQANEVVLVATKNAQNTLDSATMDANEIRRSAIRYTDELLQSIQEVLIRSIDTTRSKQEAYINIMQGYLDVITENRIQLNPNPIADEILKEERIKPQAESPAAEEAPAQEVSADTENTQGVIDIPEQFFKKD